MGIDFGRARIGIAISDELRLLARPLCILKWDGKETPFRSLAELIENHEIRDVLVGLPRNMDGTEGASAGQARRFSCELASSSRVTVWLMDERLSSREAYAAMKSDLDASRASRRSRARTALDAHAAAVILQRYLDGEAAERVHPGPSDALSSDVEHGGG
jgi:putative Holliday junction resolvase